MFPVITSSLLTWGQCPTKEYYGKPDAVPAEGDEEALTHAREEMPFLREAREQVRLLSS